MRHHLEERTADFATNAGLSPEQARRAAERKFGNLASIQEHARAAHGWRAVEQFGRDLRFAARRLTRAPGYAIVAVITLGLGIGANTAMFSVLNSTLLRPLPYPALDRLEQIYRTTPEQPKGGLSVADYQALRRADSGYAELAAHRFSSVSLAEPAQPARLHFAAQASPNLFRTLGVLPQLGRDFRADEDEPGRDRVVLLSERLWRRQFDRRADAVGRTVRIDGEPHEIIGVLPAAFNEWRHLGAVDLFRPLPLPNGPPGARPASPVAVIGRRAPDRSAAETASVVANFGAQLAREFPVEHGAATWRSVPLQSTVADADFRLMLPMVVGLSAFVLLIACSNLANLMLAGTMARAREFAVRAALGASRLHLVRPLVTEAVLLSLAGGALAVLVASWVHHWIGAQTMNDAGDHFPVVLDWKVLGWASAAALVTAIAFSLSPALFALRLDLQQTLKSGGHGATGGRGPRRFRQILVVGQFALAMILLAGAAFFVRGLEQLRHRPKGWESAAVVTGTVVLPAASYPDSVALAAFQERVRERIAAVPGVTGASVSTATPYFPWADVRKFEIDANAPTPAGREPLAQVNRVSPDYFSTFGTRLVAGRAFESRDTADAPRTFIVSQSIARAFFGDQSPLGGRLTLGSGEERHTGEIIGVAADIEAADPGATLVSHRIYVALAQQPTRQFQISARASRMDAVGLVESLRTALAEIDPDLPVRGLQSSDNLIERSLGDLRIFRDLLAAFGALGLGLAALGIYGVIARGMVQRTAEFAVRVALGASRNDIIRLVLGSGVRQALLGSAIGLLGGLALTRVIAAAFPGIQTGSAWILISVTAVLVTVALAACWLPARRAAKSDPLLALRAD